MIRHSRTTPVSGLTPAGSLCLALAGLGALVFLLFLFPRLTTSRAAEQRSQAPPLAAPGQAEEPAPEVVLLSGSPVEVEVDAPETTETLAAAPLEAPAGTELALASGAPKVEGPKLIQPKGGGRSEVTHSDLRADRKARRKQQREQGLDPAEAETRRAQAKSTVPNANRDRLKTQGGGQRTPRRGKPKNEPPQEEPEDG